MIHALAILTGAAVALLIYGATTCRLQVEDNDVIERTVFRVFGVAIGFARYDPHRIENVTGPHDGGAPALKWRPEILARPPSGAPVGIAWSFWIYTRRHAYGRAMVRDWARPGNLMFNVAEMITGAECGYFMVRPPRRYDHDARILVAVINQSGPVQAVGRVTLTGRAETGELGMNVSIERPFDVAARGVQMLDFGSGYEGADFILDKFEFKTYPAGEFRVGRLHGRPEWEPVLWRK